MAPSFIRPTSQHLRRLLGVAAMLALTGCDTSNDSSQQQTVLGDPILEVADLSNDALIPPEAPHLAVSYRDQLLTFSWQTQADTTTVRLFAFNRSTAEEQLISDQLSTTATNHIQPFDALHTTIDDWLYRIELCTTIDCVSSYRTPISTALASSQLTLSDAAGDAIWQPYLNRRGNVLVAISKQTQTAEVHFKLSSGWHYASSINPAGLSDSADNASDVAMSDSGDTVAVAVYQQQDSQIYVNVFDRLGEAWFATSQWQTSYTADNNKAPTRLIAMAADAASLLVLEENGITRYSRDGLSYQESTKVSSDTPILTWDASPELSELVWLSQYRDDNMTLNRLTFRDSSYKHSMTTSDIPLISSVNASIHINTQGSEILLAGWQSTQNLQASPTLWHAAIADDSLTVLSVQSAAVVDQPNDQLVFGSSDDLQTSYLNWADNSQHQVQIFHMDKQHFARSFDLHSAFSLDQQSYALAISGDGTRLSWANKLVHTLD